MEEVYVLVSNWANYGEQDCLILGVFHTLKSAKDRMKKAIKENHDERCDVIEKDNMWYCEYIDGEFCENHYTITICKETIK